MATASENANNKLINNGNTKSIIEFKELFFKISCIPSPEMNIADAIESINNVITVII